MKIGMRSWFSGALAAMLLAGVAGAADITPSAGTIRLEQGQKTCTFDISASVDEAFAGIELGLKPSASDVELKVEFLGDYAQTGNVQTVKDGVLYFGFYSTSNDFAAGSHDFARITCTYVGDADRTVTLDSSSIVTVDEATKTTHSDDSSAPFTVTLDRQETPAPTPGGGGSGGSGGGGGMGGGSSTEEKPSEGTVTETVKKPDGSSVTETETPDGSKGQTVVDKNGQVKAEADVSKKAVEEAAESGKPVQLPVEKLPVVQDSSRAPVVEITLPGSAPTRVIIPVENPTQGTVAVIVHPDGREEIVRRSLVTKNGVELTLTGSATVKIVDNSKTFTDVPASYWAADYIRFVTARGLYNGTSATTFSPDRAMTRGMLAKVLHNLEGNPVSAYTGSFTDVPGDLWCSEAVRWAAERGVVTGYGDGSFRPDRIITREQLAAMLYRYAGKPAVSGSLTRFPDAGSVSGFAADAMTWAVDQGIIGGTAAGTLNPQGTATRAQVAAMLTRFLQAGF